MMVANFKFILNDLENSFSSGTLATLHIWHSGLQFEKLWIPTQCYEQGLF